MDNIVPLLLAHGSPINAQDLYGNTALHLAASKGYKEVVRFLVENDKIQLNVSNKEGLTPLHLAVESGFIYTVEVRIFIFTKTFLLSFILVNWPKSDLYKRIRTHLFVRQFTHTEFIIQIAYVGHFKSMSD